MRFRYKLDKKTFKNKKVAPKRMPGWDQSHVSTDQRGDNASNDGDVLALDADTISTQHQKDVDKKNAEIREVSRRDLFSFARLGEFSEAVEQEDKKQKKKKRRADEDDEPDESNLEDDQEETENVDEESEEDDAPPPPKVGFFKKIFNKLKPGSKSDAEESQDEAVPGPNSIAASAAEAVREELRAAEEEEEVEEVPEEPEPEYDRRNLLKQGIHFFAKPAMDSVQEKIDKVNTTVDKITKRVPLIRPPGAISEKDFLNACTRCDKCIHACPKDAIKRAPKKMGFFIAGTPYIEPLKNPCVMCDHLPCISACPDGALLPVASPSDVNMGYAILDKGRCQAYGDTFCQQCVIDCPIPGAITQTVDSKPVIHKNICTGCGVCARSCSTVNIPVAIKIKPQMVVEHQLKKKRLEKEKAEREAEEQEARRRMAEGEAQEEAQEESEVELTAPAEDSKE